MTWQTIRNWQIESGYLKWECDIGLEGLNFKEELLQ